MVFRNDILKLKEMSSLSLLIFSLATSASWAMEEDKKEEGSSYTSTPLQLTASPKSPAIKGLVGPSEEKKQSEEKIGSLDEQPEKRKRRNRGKRKKKKIVSRAVSDLVVASSKPQNLGAIVLTNFERAQARMAAARAQIDVNDRKTILGFVIACKFLHSDLTGLTKEDSAHDFFQSDKYFKKYQDNMDDSKRACTSYYYHMEGGNFCLKIEDYKRAQNHFVQAASVDPETVLGHVQCIISSNYFDLTSKEFHPKKSPTHFKKVANLYEVLMTN